MSSLDHGSAAQNTTEGIRHGDFNIVAIHIHATPGRAESSIMNRKSTSKTFDIPGVVS